MSLSPLNYYRLLIQIVMIATGISLLFIAIYPNRRTAANYYFAAFAFTMSVYGLLLVLRLLPEPIRPLPPLIGLQAMATMLLSFCMMFYLVVYFFSEKRPVWVGRLSSLIPVVLFVGIGVIWFSPTFSYIGDDGISFRLGMTGYALLSIGVLYVAVTVWLTFRSDERQVRWLRFPALGILTGLLLNGVAPDLPLDTTLFTISGLGAAAALMRQKVLIPVENLNRELHATNDELRQSIVELAEEKAHVEALNHELQQANRYKTEFLANVSHELRTPLNAIIGYSELLSSPIYGTVNDQQRDRLGRIHRNGERLLHMIDIILDLSRLETHDVSLTMDRFDMHSLLLNVAAQAQPTIEEKQLVFHLDLPASLPLIVGDAPRLVRVITGLLENAVKFTSQGSITLTAKVLPAGDAPPSDISLPPQLHSRATDWLLIGVLDTGEGIPQADLATIFVTFRQLDGSSTREYGGLGLGLAFAQQVILAHDGYIWAESEPEQGSEFWMALPLIPASDRDVP